MFKTEIIPATGQISAPELEVSVNKTVRLHYSGMK